MNYWSLFCMRQEYSINARENFFAYFQHGRERESELQAFKKLRISIISRLFKMGDEVMDRDTLRAIQTPLKEKYLADPKAAVITLKAQGVLGEENITCAVDTPRALVEAGLHPATGGNNTAACSGDMLLEALVACSGVTLSAVAKSLGVKIHSGKIRAEGELDFRGTLAVSKDAPVGFKNIRLYFDLDTDANADERDTLYKLTKRYCVIYQTLLSPPEVELV